MKIRLAGGLPYVSASLSHGGRLLTLDHVVLDTGSGASVFSADELLSLGILPEPEDPLHRILGVGGSEFVYSKRLDRVALGDLEMSGFEVQVGAMDYGFPIQGILGMDFLLAVKAVIDLDRLEIFRA
jgi:predicted aspartyl protease